MIIVWVNKRDWKMPGPIVNMAVHNAASFAEIGHETHLCIGAGLESNTKEDLLHFYGIHPTDKLNIHRVHRWRLGASSYSLSIFQYAYRLIRALAQKDEIAVFTRESGFLGPLAKLCRDPRVNGFYELHDFYADLSWMVKKEIGFYREKIYEHLFLPRIDGLVCITRAQQELYRKAFPRIPSCAFPLGARPVHSNYTAEEKRKRRTLMYVGRMHAEKGLDFVLCTAARLAHAGIKLLCWGGKASSMSALEERARAFGAENCIRFAPFQPPEAMHRALEEKASLGVVMLEDTYYNRYLTCPVKALDYLSHGIPSIGSDLPSVKEVLGDAGVYVRPGDESAFLRSTTALLDDPERYRRMCRQAQTRSAEISWRNRALSLSAFAKRRRRQK